MRAECACIVEGGSVYSHATEVGILSKSLNHRLCKLKAGTFTQIEWDNTLESYGNWWWSNEALQIFGYQFVDEDYPGEEGVKFDGDRAIFFAQEYGDIDDEDYDYGVSSGDYILQERVVCRAR